MKLELKHLAPYLPYALKGVIKNTTVTLKSLNQHSLETSPSVHGFTYCCFTDFKPSLRPLSDLAKEIEHNGERFVPIDWFENNSLSDYFDGNIWVKFLFEDGRIDDLSLIPFGMIQKLKEWHFDIYGLIKNGLAIEKQ